MQRIANPSRNVACRFDPGLDLHFPVEGMINWSNQGSVKPPALALRVRFTPPPPLSEEAIAKYDFFGIVMLISLLISLLIFALVAGVIYYIITLIPLPHPFGLIVQLVFAPDLCAGPAQHPVTVRRSLPGGRVLPPVTLKRGRASPPHRYPPWRAIRTMFRWMISNSSAAFTNTSGNSIKHSTLS